MIHNAIVIHNMKANKHNEIPFPSTLGSTAAFRLPFENCFVLFIDNDFLNPKLESMSDNTVTLDSYSLTNAKYHHTSVIQ